jgi:hypothetical protein
MSPTSQAKLPSFLFFPAGTIYNRDLCIELSLIIDGLSSAGIIHVSASFLTLIIEGTMREEAEEEEEGRKKNN